MRNDFCKVVRERGPLNIKGSCASGKLPPDIEALPTREGMRSRYKRGVWESRRGAGNYTPVRRWLNTQVGRPWDAVFRDLTNTYDRRSFGNHSLVEFILNQLTPANRIHLEADDRVMEFSPYGHFYEVSGLYVHPTSGLLCHTHPDGYPNHTAAGKALWKQAQDAIRRNLPGGQHLHNLEGIWFELVLSPLLPAKVTEVSVLASWGDIVSTRVVREACCFDVVSQTYVTLDSSTSVYRLSSLYGRKHVFASAKRQLSGQELRLHGLQNTPPAL